MIKVILPLLLMATSFVAFSNSAQDATPAEKAALIKKIDDHCGDSWCESFHTFRFRSVAFNHTTQELRLDFVIGSEDKPKASRGNDTRAIIYAAQFPASCLVSDTAPIQELNRDSEAFYSLISKLNECMGNLMRRVPLALP